MYWYLKCWKKYADFSGRARRKEYWMFILCNVIIYFILGAVDRLLGFTGHEFDELLGFTDSRIGIGVFGGIYSLAVLIPSIAVAVRRLHDIDKGGWNFLVGFIPIVGPILLIVWFCKEGKYGANKWGEDPKL